MKILPSKLDHQTKNVASDKIWFTTNQSTQTHLPWRKKPVHSFFTNKQTSKQANKQTDGQTSKQKSQKHPENLLVLDSTTRNLHQYDVRVQFGKAQECWEMDGDVFHSFSISVTIWSPKWFVGEIVHDVFFSMVPSQFPKRAELQGMGSVKFPQIHRVLGVFLFGT